MIHIITGTRPNIVKAAPLCRALDAARLRFDLIHTGQHFDHCMAGAFFECLGLPPAIDADSFAPAIKSTRDLHACGQICALIHKLNIAFKNSRPDLVIVFGDVNSSLAAALVANKMGIPLAHVEAGERSFDRTMPEEMNRVLIDEMADLLFCSSLEAFHRLNGWHPDQIQRRGQEVYHVGNIVSDQLLYTVASMRTNGDPEGLPGPVASGEKYAVLTLHRQSNVDNRDRLASAIGAASVLARRIPVIFPIHPRTKNRVSEFGLEKDMRTLTVVDPMVYEEFVCAINGASMVLTDSGGLQVEASILDVPCLTLRENTEWMDTISIGTNALVGLDGEKLLEHAEAILTGKWKHRQTNVDWDGRAAERIVKILKKGVKLCR